MNNERTCVLCGKKYSYCPRCKEYEGLPSWYLRYDSENCNDIALILNKHVFKKLTDEEARAELSAKDLSLKEKFPEEIRAQIETIMVKQEVVAEAAPVVEVKKTKKQKPMVNEN